MFSRLLATGSFRNRTSLAVVGGGNNFSTFTIPPYPKFNDPCLNLRNLLDTAFDNKKSLKSFGILHPIQAVVSAPHLDCFYVSGWQTSAPYGPDVADYASTAIPEIVRQIKRSVEYHTRKQGFQINYDKPIIADADTGFGGFSSIMKLTKDMIDSGVGGFHLEDQAGDYKVCGHLGGKVLVPTQEHINRLNAARLQAYLLNSKVVIICRTDAESAQFITSDHDDRDKPFIVQGSKTPEGFYTLRNGNDYAIARAIEYAPFCDMIWIETSSPNLEQAEYLARGIHRKFPKMKLAYNLSPSFNWAKSGMTYEQIIQFQERLDQLGYVWHFGTIIGFKLVGYHTEMFARKFKQEGILAYVRDIQRMERENGAMVYEHQKFAGAPYHDLLRNQITGGKHSTRIMGDRCTEKHF